MEIKRNDKMFSRRCPQCGAAVKWEGNRFRPFCSSRCKQVDLGKWLREEYSLPVPDAEGMAEMETEAKTLH